MPVGCCLASRRLLFPTPLHGESKKRSVRSDGGAGLPIWLFRRADAWHTFSDCTPAPHVADSPFVRLLLSQAARQSQARSEPASSSARLADASSGLCLCGRQGQARIRHQDRSLAAAACARACMHALHSCTLPAGQVSRRPVGGMQVCCLSCTDTSGSAVRDACRRSHFPSAFASCRGRSVRRQSLCGQCGWWCWASGGSVATQTNTGDDVTEIF